MKKAVSIVMLIVLLLSPLPLVFAAKFNLGDTVEVYNTGASGLLVRDAPAGNIIPGKNKYDGYRGMILAGPQSASLGGVVYTWWKVRWGDDALEGWSAEGYPGGVDYLRKVSISPSTKFASGDYVKVYNMGGSSLVVRTDPPALSYKGSVVENTAGKVEGGPFYGVAEGRTGFYYFWKINFGSVTGYSAEDWLMKSAPSDLTIETSTDIWISPSPFYPGDTVTIYTRIKNIGSSAAVSDQGLWMKALFDSSPCYQEAIEGLGSGYTYTFQWSYVWPSNTNSHTIQATVDPNNYIVESNEANNVRSRSFSANSPPVNNPPFSPSNPSPLNHASGISTSTVLSWSGGDPDVGDTVTYDVCFGVSSSPPLVSSGQSATTYNPSTLSYSTTYYWKIVARDNHGLSTTGSVWDFTTQSAPVEYRTLTVYSSPSGVVFTADGSAHTTPWSATYAKGTSVSLVMPSPYSNGDARYYWDRWSDGVTSSSRTITLNSDTTLTGSYIGPYYELIIASSPVSGIPFTLDGASKTTAYSEWLYQGYYTIEMPATYNEYVWQRWLEDGNTNRIRTVLLATSTLLTGVYSLPGPSYEPKLSVPVYAPIYQKAYTGTIVTFVFEVTNDGVATDTIVLSVSETYDWSFQLSQSSVTLGSHQSTQVFLYVTTGDDPVDTITMKGTSQGDPSKTSSCQVRVEPFPKGQGLLNIWLQFSNKDSQQHYLIFHAPGQHYTVPLPSYVKLSSDTMTLNPSQQVWLYVFFDLSSPESGLNSISIGVTDIPSEDSTSIQIGFDGFEITATNFGLTEDSYSFKNGVYHTNTCYGMAATSILYSKNPLLLYQKYGKLSTYGVTQEEAEDEILRYQVDFANFGLGVDLTLPGSPNKEAYEELEENIRKNNPMVLGLFFGVFQGHAVVAYGIVKEGNKAYILIYDNEAPYSTVADIDAFKYATYDLTTHKLIYLNSECEFLVYEPKEDIVSQPLPEGLSQVGQWGHWMKSRLTMIFDCPVNITINDQYGRVISDNGTNQIPGATFTSMNETKYFCLPLDLTYNVSIVAYDVGNFTLMIVRPIADSSVSIDIYENVYVDSGAQATLEIMPYQTNQTMKIDNDGDGVIDESRNPSVNEAIHIPLLSYTFSIVFEEEAFTVSVESNSTVSNFAFSQPTKEICFDVTGLAGTIGLCNVTIPKTLLYGEPWTLLIDGAQVPATILENATHTFLYFTYTHSTHTIQIIGTWVIGPTPDTNPPLIQTPFQQPEPDKVTPDQAVTVYVNVTDMESGVKTVILSYTTNGGATWNNLTMLYNATTALYQATIPAFPSGTNIYYKVIAYDNADNVAIDDNAGQYYCYTVNPPAPPPLSVSISPLSASFLVGQSVTFTSAVSGGYTPYGHQWHLNGAPVSGATSNTWTFTPTTGGIYYIHLKVTDAKGNTTQSQTARITAATVPVGGYSIPIERPATAQLVLPYIALVAALTAVFTKLRPKTKRKRQKPSNAHFSAHKYITNHQHL